LVSASETPVTYRPISSTDPLWRTAGVGSTDVASLMNCAARSEEKCLLCWARIVQKRDLQENPELKTVKLDQGSQDWLDWRKFGVGGSEVSAVVGANPYSDSKADKVYRRKLPSDHPDHLPEVSSNPAMDRGKKLEPIARNLYSAIFGWNVDDLCIIHDQYDFVRCSLDGMRPDGELTLEIKCSGDKNHAKYLGISRLRTPMERQQAFDAAFRYYRYQVLYQLLITGAKVCHFVGYNPDWQVPADRLCVFELYPEPEEQERLLKRVVEFWSFVENRTPPPKEWLQPCWRPPKEIKMPSDWATPNSPAKG